MAIHRRNGFNAGGGYRFSGSSPNTLNKISGVDFDRNFKITIDTTLGSGTQDWGMQFRHSFTKWAGSYFYDGSAAVFWGDGTDDRQIDNGNVPISHAYSSPGQYDITIVGPFLVSTGYLESDKVVDVKKWEQPQNSGFGGPYSFPNMTTMTANDCPWGSGGPAFFTAPNCDWNLESWKDILYRVPMVGTSSNERIMYTMSSLTSNGVSGVGVGADTWNFPGQDDKATGTNTSVSSFRLIDNTGQFTSDIAETVIGNFVNTRMVYNNTTGQVALNTGAFGSANWPDVNTLVLDTDIFTSVGDSYTVVLYWDGRSGGFDVLAGWSLFNGYIGSWNLKGYRAASSYLRRGWLIWNNGDPAGFAGGGAGQGIDNWDIRGFRTLSFIGSPVFNQYINSWDVRNVVNFNSCFDFCYMYNRPLNNWQVGGNLTASDSGTAVHMFRNCTIFNQEISQFDTTNFTDLRGMFIFCTAWNNGGVNLGAGQGLDNWNVNRCNSFESMFESSAYSGYLGNWNILADGTDVNFRKFFKNCNNFAGQDLHQWDVSGVNDWRETFVNTNVNFALTHPNYWEIRDGISAGNITNPFTGTPFNGGQASGVGGRNCEFKIGTDPAKSWNLQQFFYGCSDFNQDISTDSVNGYWVMTRVTSVNSLLQGCTQFNHELTNWDTSNMTDMGRLFDGCIAFTNGGVNGVGVGLDTWDVSNNTNFSTTFRNMGNNTVDWYFESWNTSNLENLAAAFYGNCGNPHITTWDVSNVTAMNSTFQANSTFNRDITGWNTAKVESMANMFYQNSGFTTYNVDQWSIASLTNASSMYRFASTSVLSRAKYDAILDSTTGWASQATIQTGVNFGANVAQYTLGGNAEAGRNILTGTYGWTIVDLGGV
jgi:surface protein